MRQKIGRWAAVLFIPLLGLCASGSVLATQTHSALSHLTHLQEIAENRYGRPAANSVNRWRSLLDASTDLPEQEKLKRINQFFNLHVYYDEDKRIWQKADYWATPLETLVQARGDCEDYTIAKYISLRLLDIPEDKLKLTYVNLYPVIGDNSTKQAHMVLAYYPDEKSEPLYLDNLQGQILPASKRPELKPVFSFNDSTMWVNGEKTSVKPSVQLSRWRDVLNRMHNDGM